MHSIFYRNGQSSLSSRFHPNRIAQIFALFEITYLHVLSCVVEGEADEDRSAIVPLDDLGEVPLRRRDRGEDGLSRGPGPVEGDSGGRHGRCRGDAATHCELVL